MSRARRPASAMTPVLEKIRSSQGAFRPREPRHHVPAAVRQRDSLRNGRVGRGADPRPHRQHATIDVIRARRGQLPIAAEEFLRFLKGGGELRDPTAAPGMIWLTLRIGEGQFASPTCHCLLPRLFAAVCAIQSIVMPRLPGLPARASANLTVAYDVLPGQGFERGKRSTSSLDNVALGCVFCAAASDAVSIGEATRRCCMRPRSAGRCLDQGRSRNPTWSFKDRLASSALTMARRFGAKVIASSSSGNAGAAAAAYAAKGRPAVHCLHLRRRIGAAGGADACPTAPWSSPSRTRPIAGACNRPACEFGWYPTSPFFGPVVGSNPYGMEGYKTIAHEIAEAFVGTCRTGACCRSATAMPSTGCGRASRS